MNTGKLKKWLVIGLAAVMTTALMAGCGSDSGKSTDKGASTKKELKYSKSQGPYSDLFEKGVKPILEKKGYKFAGKDMSDLLQADIA